MKEERPDLKGIEITKELGVMWAGLDQRAKAKIEKKVAKAKEEYKEKMKDYVRPSDEELSQLPINQKVKRGATGSRKKKDPNAPKHPKNAYMYFSMDKRAEVKEAHPEYSSQEVSKELGRMWKEEYAEKKDREEWVEKAMEAKEEYDNLMKTYVPGEHSEDENPSPKKRGRGRPKKSKEPEQKKKEESEEESENDMDEE
jgi:hypothetical protein